MQQRHPGLRLLALLGSQATGTAHEDSDWDLGMLADPGLDLLGLRADLVDRLGTDRVDLVDLTSASAGRSSVTSTGSPTSCRWTRLTCCRRPRRRTPSSYTSGKAVQITIDLGVSWCVRAGLGAPPTYGDAFRRLASAGRLDPALADRLVRAVGLRNLVVDAYADLDLARVHEAALTGPGDLRAFAVVLAAATVPRDG